MENSFDYRKIKSLLSKAGIEDAGFEARLLIEKFYPELSSAEILAGGQNLNSAELSEAVKKRCERYPLQYILGSWGFCKENYFVTPDCLIPRAETELLVELGAKLLPKHARFIDLCTGSGCIAVSTLAKRSDVSAVAVDLFPRTLELASKNAEANGVLSRIEFKMCDVLSHCAGETVCGDEKFDAIFSNPPYIKSADIASLEPELANEPSAALDGGADGLDFYRAIIGGFAPFLKDNGFFLFEAGADTARGVAGLGEAAGFCAEVVPDLAGLDRMILLTKNRI